MAKQRVENTQTYQANIATVFNWFAVHKNLDEVFQGNKHKLVKAAAGDNPYAAGSVRSITIAGLPLPAFEETVTVFEAPHRYEYTIIKGSPLKNHYGVMEFTEAAGATTLHYVIEFEGRVPGPGSLIAKSVNKQVQAGLLNAKTLIEAG